MAKKKQNGDESDDLENINRDADDTFGLPEVEYEPLKREEPHYEAPREETSSYEEPRVEETPRYQTYKSEPVEERTYQSPYSSMEEDRSIWPKILGIAFIVLLAGAITYYFAYYRPQQEKDKAARALAEQNKRKADEKRANDERLAQLQRDAEQRRLDSLANLKPQAGAVTTLNERTGRYYVVVASAIDDDLLMDYANKIALTGKTCKVIPPFGKTKFYRLTIDDKDTYADAQATADQMKGGDFGSELWVVKY